MSDSSNALPLSITLYLWDFIFHFSLYHEDSWSLPHRSALLRSYSNAFINLDCEFILKLYTLNCFQPFKLSFVDVVNQINAIARFSDWFVKQRHLVDVWKNCLHFFFLLVSVRFFVTYNCPILPFLIHVTSHPLINSTRRGKYLIKRTNRKKNNYSGIISYYVSNWIYSIIFVSYLCKYEILQDVNKQGESNVPLAHDLICVQHRKQTLLHLGPQWVGVKEFKDLVEERNISLFYLLCTYYSRSS